MSFLFSSGVRTAIPDSAIHHWKFDEGSGTTVEDEIGTKDGTITGATWQTGGDWTGGYYLAFDGVDDYVDTTSVIDVSADDYTLLITAEASVLDGDVIWAPETGQDVRLRTNGGAINWAPFDGSTSYYLTSSAISTNTRYRIAVRVDNTNSTAALFVNGTQEDSNTTGADAVNTSEWDASFGKSRSNSDNDWEGKLDNPIVTDEPLSDTEIQDDYNAQPWS